jgi:hypothetical protein
MGAPCLVETPKDISYVDLAVLELTNKKTPFILMRPLPNNKIEPWEIDEMHIPTYLWD